MKILLSHLRSYIELPKSLDEISQLLLQAGIEVDGIEVVRPLFEGIVAVKVMKTTKHPQSDKLTLAEIFDGDKHHTVVCGAPNCRSGMMAAFAPVGAKLYQEGRDRAPLVIEKSAIRGVESPGMLLSEKELGIGQDDDGIVSLDGLVPGELLQPYIEDTVLELGLTPNLGHAMSVYGIARELSVQSGRPLLSFPRGMIDVNKAFKEHEASFVTVESKELCPRYIALEVEGVSVKPSPFSIRHTLASCGMRSVNNVVDITNLVLLELGQPMHAFDTKKLQGQQIIVRGAKSREPFELLDGQKVMLPEGACVIADAAGPIAVGGVMGGASSCVDESTQSILFEAANFSATAVRRAAKKLGVSTESSKRFERGCDPEMTVKALEYAYFLLRQQCPDVKIQRFSDTSSPKAEAKTITVRRSRTSQILGYEVSADEMDLCWKRLGFEVASSSGSSENAELYTVSIPSYRHDIHEEIDLIEDIAKILGYQREGVKDPVYAASNRPHHPHFLAEKLVRKRLVGAGLQECITCNLISPQMVDVVLNHPIQPNNLVTMLNPLSSEQSVLRPSLLPGLLKVVKHNINQRTLDLKLFEVGNVHLKRDDKKFEEQLVAAIALTGLRQPHHFETGSSEVDFYDLKGVVEGFLQSFGIESFELIASSVSVFHPGRQAAVLVGDVQLGMLGELHPAILRKIDVTQRIYFAEFDVQELMKLEKRQGVMRPLPLFPASERDLTFTVSEEVSWEQIKQVIAEVRSNFMESYSLVAVYRSDKVGIGKKNITIHFVYRRLDKTISQEEVDLEHKKITDACAHTFAFVAE